MQTADTTRFCISSILLCACPQLATFVHRVPAVLICLKEHHDVTVTVNYFATPSATATAPSLLLVGTDALCLGQCFDKSLPKSDSAAWLLCCYELSVDGDLGHHGEGFLHDRAIVTQSVFCLHMQAACCAHRFHLKLNHCLFELFQYLFFLVTFWHLTLICQQPTLAFDLF